MLKNKKVLIVVAFALVLILTSTAFSFTAANTVPGSRLGEGQGAISGYVVTDIDYVTSDTYPSNLTSVVLTLDNSAEWVKISLDTASHTFYPCATSSGTTWTCDTSALGSGSVLAAANLVVIAGD